MMVHGHEDGPHVEVKAPSLGEVFPGMGSGVRTDEAALPIWRSFGFVIFFEGVGVGRIAVVAEDCDEGVFAFAFDERHPIVVADFVTHVADEGAMGLVHLLADTLALDGVGFGDIDGDAAVGVAGEDLVFGRAGFEVEDERFFGADVFRGVFQVQLIELDEEPAFGEL